MHKKTRILIFGAMNYHLLNKHLNNSNGGIQSIDKIKMIIFFFHPDFTVGT